LNNAPTNNLKEEVMKKSQKFLIVLTLLMFSATQLLAADGWVVVQKTWKFGQGTLMAIGSGKEMSDPAKMADYFLNLSLDQLLDGAKKSGDTPDIEETTISVQGDFVRIDTKSDGENMAVILNRSTGEIIFIRQDRNKFARTSTKQMQDMQKKAMAGLESMSNMPNMEEILKSLPEKDRKKAMEAMEAAKKSGYKMPGMQEMEEKPERQIKKIGKDSVNDFPCEKNWVTEGDKTILICVTRAMPELTKIFHDVANDTERLFNMGQKDERDDLWKEFPDAVPVLEKKFTFSMYGNGELEVNRMESAVQKNVDERTFKVTGDLTEVPLMQLMMQ
jgi:hypothetical protein